MKRWALSWLAFIMSSHWSEVEAVGGVEFTLSTKFAATAKIALLSIIVQK